MSCDEIRALFSDHLDGALEAPDEDRLGLHLAECAACREALLAYERPLTALGGLGRPIPPELWPRVLEAARHSGLVRQGWLRPGRWLVPFAAGLLVAGGGSVLFVRRSPPAPASAMLPEGCTASLTRLARIEPRALYAPLSSSESEDRFSMPAYTVVVPDLLRTSGPYRAAPQRAVACGDAWRLPLLSPYGDLLVLSISPAPRGRAAAPAGYEVVTDARRVFYARVQWQEGGLSWSLEGRAAAGELLQLAAELRGRARVTAT